MKYLLFPCKSSESPKDPGRTGAIYEAFVEWDNSLAICALQNNMDIIAEVVLPEEKETSNESSPEDE